MITPFSYQSECRSVLETVRSQGKRQALVVMASGLGKTVMAALDSQAWLSQNGGRFLYLCHQNDILGQARGTFESILGERYTYGYFHGLEKRIHNVDCVFASFQTMTKSAIHLFKPDEFDYIVVDESHHTHALTYLKVVQHFKPKFLLGLTATPDRRDGQNIRSVYGEEVYYLPLEEAIARGLVTPVDYRLVTDEISTNNVDTENAGGLTVRELDERIFTPQRDEEIASVIERNAQEFSEPKIIVFASAIDRTEQLARSIGGSAPIHSRVPIKERMVRMELFRQGLIPTVLTVDCFNEGIDIPQANVIVFLRSTTSSTIFFQQLGRGLRRYEGKDKVIVLDFVGNCERISMLKDLSDTIENRKRRLPRGPRMTTYERSDHEPSIHQVSDAPGIKFDEKAIQVLDIIKRIRPKRIADVPELLKEFSPKNPVSASYLSARAYRPVWWQCAECGYEWQISPSIRLSGKGCPQCETRVTEKNSLTTRYPIIAGHFSPRNPITADQIHCASKDVYWWLCMACGYEYQTSVRGRTMRYDSCPACAARLPYAKQNFAYMHPELIEEYSYLNHTSPEIIAEKSGKKRHWTCKVCGHTWQASTRMRVAGKGGCPICTASVATKATNLFVTHPHLAEEFSSRNRKLADTVLANTDEKLWWICLDCGRYWQATGRERLNGASCPTCRQSIPASPTLV